MHPYYNLEEPWCIHTTTWRRTALRLGCSFNLEEQEEEKDVEEEDEEDELKQQRH